jgi:Tol biopolymer transport system component
MQYDLDGGSQPLLDYSDPMVEDALPTFSPDGQWLAFTRKYLDEERWTPGRQLWLLNMDSGELSQLTDSPNHQVIAIAWSPDGQQIAYVRANQVEFQNPLELWITYLDGSASQLIAVDAYAPAWVP